MKSVPSLTAAAGATRSEERARPLAAPEARRRRTPQESSANVVRVTKFAATKIVAPRAPSSDPRVIERERLTAALVAARGRSAIAAATEALLGAGHSLPADQEVLLQVLEHTDEARVRASIEHLGALLGDEPARHRPVLEQRLRRLEEFADEPATRAAAAALRRKL
jgi:hypothetical protein